MAVTEGMSIVTELIGEVESYLPDMDGFLRLSVGDSTGINDSEMKELHRMTHTIKGAAAMVQLDGLSRTAALMEDELDEVLAGRQSLSRELAEAMAETVEHIGLYCASLHKGEADGDELYETTRTAFEAVGNSFQGHSLLSNDSAPTEDDIFALLGDDGEDESTDDFFKQMSDEEETKSGDELETLRGRADSDSEDSGLDVFLAAGSDDSGELDPDSDTGEAFSPPSPGIDPELQECFNEEVVEHLENLSSQLNRLFSTVTGPTAINGDHRQVLHSIRRSVHTMKGAAAVIGIDPVAAWGHDFEDFLDWLHDESTLLSPEIVSVMLDGSDLLEKIAADPTTPVDPEINTILSRFQAIISEHAPDLEVIESIAPEEPLPSPSPGIDPELQESFNEEAEEHLDNIARQLNELSSSVSGRVSVTDAYREKLHSIRRSVHTLKGAAAVIGITPVADWGHDFEDFLDSLHDESDTLSPKSISAMQDGTDILEKIVANPNVDVSADISNLQDIFPTIMMDSHIIEEKIPEESFPQTVEKQETLVEPDSSEDITEQISAEEAAKQFTPVRITRLREKRRQPRKRTLRVGSEKIAGLMGLGGDMAINLSSFENSTLSMQSNLAELEMTLQRLKGIASSLEAGYELASIPHLGTAAGTGQNEYGITDDFDPLEMDRYSELHILIRSLNEAVVDIDSIREQNSEIQNSWRLAVDRQRRVVGDMQGAVQSIQMTPFSTLTNRLYRTVRESARATNKKVRLLIEGGSLEMDTHIWDVLADALMHMLRNSVDHGVESADERQRVGKPEQATITIHCNRRGSHFTLRLSDDGSGLDYDAIRSRASSLYPKTGVEQMDNKELGTLIFKQGFSIRAKVTSLSGRGVGMDVVRDALDHLNGSIEVHSNPGQGTDFLLSVPIVVAQLPALMVMFGRQQFAIPMRDVSRVLRLSDEEKVGATFELNNETLPLLRPAELLHSAAAASRTLRDSSLALAVETGGKRGVLVADAVIGQRNVVFKSLGSHLQITPCVAGATILGDGSLVPILQTEDLFTLAETSVQQRDEQIRESDAEDQTLEILIADDSISIRKVLSNFITAQGWKVLAAHDGVDAMEKIRVRKPDLVILDIEMPRMNGFEVLQTLQSQSAYREIPILMLTSRSADKYREKAKTLGARGFVTKPFKDDELISLISSVTTQKSVRGHQ